MEVQSGIALAKLRKRLYYLSVIVTMAPLLGLLGTISGMITSFSVFNLESGQPTAITGGVGEALIATAMGLCVAIISLTVHAYFSQRIENIVTDNLCRHVHDVARQGYQMTCDPSMESFRQILTQFVGMERAKPRASLDPVATPRRQSTVLLGSSATAVVPVDWC